MVQRDKSEKDFFASSKWTGLKTHQLGVPVLNTRLATLLYQHVQAAVPGLQDSLIRKLKEVNTKLYKLGPGRGTNLEHRGLLVEIASNFQRLAEVAIDGNYKKDPFFGMSPRKASTEYTTEGHRLRALVQDKHRQFSHALRRFGSRYNVTEIPAEWESSGGLNDSLGFTNTALEFPYNSFASDQKKMTYAAYITYVQSIEKRFRGTQLSGIFNPDIVDELFHEQSSRWSGLAKAHIDNVHDYCKDFVGKLVAQIAPPDIAERLEARVEPTLEQRRKKALKELEKFVQVERGVLMTYDPEFTVTIERLRAERMERRSIEGSKPPVSDATLGGSPARALKMPRIDTKNQINMDGLAAEDAFSVSWVYCRSQREHFVAYLTKHIIEQHMIEWLDHIMSPKEFGSMPITETRSLAVEAEELVEERRQLLRNKQILEKGKAKFDAALEKKNDSLKTEPDGESE